MKLLYVPLVALGLLACEGSSKKAPAPAEIQEPQRPSKDLEPPVKELEPPVKELEPPVKELEPPVKELEPPVKELEPPVKELEPPVKEPANSNQAEEEGTPSVVKPNDSASKPQVPADSSQPGDKEQPSTLPPAAPEPVVQQPLPLVEVRELTQGKIYITRSLEIQETALKGITCGADTGKVGLSFNRETNDAYMEPVLTICNRTFEFGGEKSFQTFLPIWKTYFGRKVVKTFVAGFVHQDNSRSRQEFSSLHVVSSLLDNGIYDRTCYYQSSLGFLFKSSACWEIERAFRSFKYDRPDNGLEFKLSTGETIEVSGVELPDLEKVKALTAESLAQLILQQDDKNDGKDILARITSSSRDRDLATRQKLAEALLKWKDINPRLRNGTYYATAGNLVLPEIAEQARPFFESQNCTELMYGASALHAFPQSKEWDDLMMGLIETAYPEALKTGFSSCKDAISSALVYFRQPTPETIARMRTLLASNETKNSALQYYLQRKAP